MSQDLKIAILAPISYKLPTTGYAPWEKVVETLAKGLSAKGVDVTVFAAADSTRTEDFKLVTTVETSLENTPQYKFQQEMLHISKAISLIRSANFDLVHNHINWYGALALEIAGLKALTTIHGYEPEAAFVYPQLKSMRFVSISKSQQKLTTGINYEAAIYNGIDFSQFATAKTKQNYLITAARICHDKGIHNSIALAKATGHKLYLAGKITDERYFAEQVAPHLANGLVEYLGELPQSELKGYLANAKAYISLLEWDEPFGLSVAEAIASGTPIIANHFGSMPELVLDGVTGILVRDTAEAAERFAEISKIDSGRCREQGRSMFSIEKMVADYLEVYLNMTRN